MYSCQSGKSSSTRMKYEFINYCNKYNIYTIKVSIIYCNFNSINYNYFNSNKNVFIDVNNMNNQRFGNIDININANNMNSQMFEKISNINIICNNECLNNTFNNVSLLN